MNQIACYLYLLNFHKFILYHCRNAKFIVQNSYKFFNPSSIDSRIEPTLLLIIGMLLTSNIEKKIKELNRNAIDYTVFIFKHLFQLSTPSNIYD